MATQTQTKTQYPSQTTHTYASSAASNINSSSSGSPSTSAFGIKLDLGRSSSSSPGPSHEDNANTPPVPPPKDTPLRRHTSLSMPIPVISTSPPCGLLPDKDKDKDAKTDTDLLDSTGHALRIVRFDNECVLIPDVQEVQHSRLLPMVVTKSYSLPLWKRRNPSPSPVRQSPNSVGGGGVMGAGPMGASATTNELDVVDEDEDDPSGSSSSAVDVGAVQEERERVVLKVPIPLFRRRSSRSPTRSPTSFSPLGTSPTKSRFRSHSTSPTIPKKLPPSCLVHRSTTQAQAQPPLSTIKDTDTLLLPASLPPLAPVRRRASLSSSITSSVSASSIHAASSPGVYAKRPSDQTIPLRACCAACEHAMDAYLLQGDKYEEKFTRGARRRSRRSASLDSGSGGHSLHSGPALPLSLTSSPSSAFTATYTPAKPRLSPSAMQTQFADLSRGVDGSLLGSASPTSPASPSPLSLGPLGVRASTSTKNKFGLTVDEVDKRRKSADLGLSVVGTVGGGIREEEGEGEGGNGDEDGDGEEVEGGVQGLLEPFEAAVPLSTESPPLGGGSDVNTLLSVRYNGGQVKKPKAAPLGPRRRMPSSPSTTSNDPYFPPMTSSSTQDGLRASPIPEETLTPTRYDEEDEDESMLFPLPTPSPRRSPNGSKVSLVGGTGTGTGAGGSPTFVEARGGLSGNGNNGNGNGGGGGSRNSSQESLLKASLSRRVSPLYLDMSVMPLSSSSGGGAAAESERSKKNGVGLGLASPKGPRSPMVPTATASAAAKRWSPSPSGSPSLAGPSTPPPGGISLNDDVLMSSTPLVGSNPPKSLVPLRASTPVISSSSPPKPSSAAQAQAHISTPSSSSASTPIPIPTSPKPTHTIFPHTTPTHTPTQSQTSASGTPSTSPQKRKLSFTFPFIRAGEAVLKGVSSIGGMGSVGGV